MFFILENGTINEFNSYMDFVDFHNDNCTHNSTIKLKNIIDNLPELEDKKKEIISLINNLFIIKYKLSNTPSSSDIMKTIQKIKKQLIDYDNDIKYFNFITSPFFEENDNCENKSSSIEKFITDSFNNNCPICGKKIDMNNFTELYYVGGFEQTGVCQDCQIKREKELNMTSKKLKT